MLDLHIPILAVKFISAGLASLFAALLLAETVFTSLAGAVILLIGSVTGPVILAAFMNRQRGVERVEEGKQRLAAKQEDWKRQDEVAARLEKSDRAARAIAEKVSSTVEIIHTLVNSAFTASMQSEHDSMVRELAMMREVVSLKGGVASPEAAGAIEATEIKLKELRAKLDERIAQGKIAEEQGRQAQEKRTSKAEAELGEALDGVGPPVKVEVVTATGPVAVKHIP